MNSVSKKKLISIVAGGTGGHIFPAISLIKFLKDKYNILIITDNRGSVYFTNFKKKNYLSYNFKLVAINSQSPFKYGLINKVIFIFLSVLTALKILNLFLKHKPILLIGFGGYSTFIPCLMSKIMGIKFFIHEQNAMMGRANKFLEFFATISFLGFKNTKPKINIKKRIFCGTPLREEFYKINKYKSDYNYIKQNFNILIFGGSLGSDYFSTQIPNLICSLNKSITEKLNISHQVVNEKILPVQSIYKKNKISANVKSFFPDMIKYFKKADLIIARAGGSTIAEILVSKIPSVIIPLPNSLDNHQFLNSKIISKNKLGWVISEKELNSTNLKKIFNKITKSKVSEKKIKKNFEILNNKLSKFSNNKLPNEIINEAIKKIDNKKIN